jgi:hypothetical protein
VPVVINASIPEIPVLADTARKRALTIVGALLTSLSEIPQPCGCDDAEKEMNSSQEQKPKRVSNPKHHPNSNRPEPKNAQELFDRSIADGKGVRWGRDSDGTIHRFSVPSKRRISLEWVDWWF